MRQVVAVFVVTRVALFFTVLAAVTLFPPAQCSVCRSASTNGFLSALANWDGAAYLEIARRGYQQLDASYAAYFPLYPLLMSVGGIVGSTEAYVVAGLVVSNTACLAAAALLARLSDEAGHSGLATATTYLLIFPTTIFLSALYADSLFIALAIASALAARRSRWWASGALAAGATLARPFGMLAIVPLAVALWTRRGALRFRDVVPLALGPVAFAAWVAYLYGMTGDPLAIIHGYTSGFTPRQPLQAFTDLLDPTVYGFPWLVAGLFALFVALTLLAWRAASGGLAAYATAMMLVIGGAGSLTSSMRYELSVYPAFISLASITRRAPARIVWSLISFALALLLAGMFALYYWVG